MSDEINVPSTPVESTPNISMPDIGNISGAEAVALAAEAKASGKSIEEVFASKNAPKEPQIDPVKSAAAEVMKKFKVKINGIEQEVEEAELLRGYGHQSAANKIFQEGKQQLKQAEEFIAMMRDPDKFFEVAKQLGHDPRILAEQRLVRDLEEDLMDPRDKELRDARNRLKQIDDLERIQKEAVENQRNEALKAKYSKDYSDQFIQALEATNLPATKAMVSEMAKYIGRSAQIGFEMTASEAASLVKEDILMAHQRLIGDADGEVLIKLLGDNVANKVRKYDMSKVKNPEANLSTPENQGIRREPKTSTKRMTDKEWREFNRR